MGTMTSTLGHAARASLRTWARWWARSARRAATAAQATCSTRWENTSTAAEQFDIGRQPLHLTDAATIGLYSAERSIIDAFRLRHQQGADLAHQALRRWLRRRDASPGAMIRMAEDFPKALPALRAALEVLL
jgi:hypothetical protein